MTPDVKSGAETRAERTEGRIVAAAAELFLAHGYRGTTLSEVATAAGVSDRTIYVRFATKADLLKRVIDVAVVGDTKQIDLAHRDWVVTTMSAPTLEERLRADAAGTTELFARLAPLVAVAQQVEADEPVIADAAKAGRDGTLASTRFFWSKLRGDGLMNPDCDLEWVIATCGLLGTAETYLHMTRTIAWSSAEYERWRYRTWWHLAITPGPPANLLH
jgi:AcrR family transcriptional regulator